MGDGLKIELARVYGFCPGVRRAVRMVEEHLEGEGPLATLGAIVHNAHVVEHLERKGARVAKAVSEVEEPTVAITAHGAGQEVYSEIEKRGLKLVDTTCPIVKRAQEAARTLAEAGYTVVIYGEESHPEVRGMLSWTKGKGHATMSPGELPELSARKLAVISQTTKDREAFWGFVRDVISRFHPTLEDLQVVDTTCPETGRRYQAALELAQRVQAIFVVGSRNSANTRKLAETCQGTGVKTHFIESAEEIDPRWLSGISRVGVTAGSIDERFKGPRGEIAPEGMVEAALWEVRLLEQVGFHDIVISLKAHQVPLTVEANRLIAREVDYPLHLGITEPGPDTAGIVRSAVGIGILLSEGIGDTVRVSLPGDPVREVEVAWEILKALGLRERGASFIVCPTCARTGVDIPGIAEEVRRALSDITEPVSIAIMGCPVNGLGEVERADFGILGGKGYGTIYAHGKVFLPKVPEGKLPEELVNLVRSELEVKQDGQ